MYQNIEGSKYRDFNVRTLKVFGGIQIGLGSLCGILGIAGVAVDSIKLNKMCNTYYDKNDYNYNYNCGELYYDTSALLGFDISCLVFSGWVSV